MKSLSAAIASEAAAQGVTIKDMPVSLVIEEVLKHDQP
jgi:hypothetical protein